MSDKHNNKDLNCLSCLYNWHSWLSLKCKLWVLSTAILDTAIVERGRNIVTCSRDGTARLWDVGEKKELFAWSELGGEINCCTLAATDNSVQLGVPDKSPSKFLVSGWKTCMWRLYVMILAVEGAILSFKPPPHAITVPQAFDLATMRCCADWWNRFELDSSTPMNCVICLVWLQLGEPHHYVLLKFFS